MELHSAWFSTLGAPLGEGEEADIRAYLAGLGLAAKLPTLLVESWGQAAEMIRNPAAEWWAAEERERVRLEQRAKLDPADPQWLALTDALHGAAAVAAARTPGSSRRLPARPPMPSTSGASPPQRARGRRIPSCENAPSLRGAAGPSACTAIASRSTRAAR
jgi:hypothetical protein